MDRSNASSPSIFETIFNHVALPPRLPSKLETPVEKIEHGLVNRLLDASKRLMNLANGEYSSQWNNICKSIKICKIVNAGGRLNKTTLLDEFRCLQHNELLILHIAEQNSGLLIQRQQSLKTENVLFEAFEASPLSEKVLASENALQWDFPGCAATLPYTEFIDYSLQENLANFLEQASTESVKQFAAHSSKAGSRVFESRNTSSPTLITHILMMLLEANGCRAFPPLLRKRVRDDVCWADGAEKPWRRCAFWLVLRVGVQRHLSILFGGELGRASYKFLTCLMLAHLVDETLDHLDPELLVFLRKKLCRRLVKLEVDKNRASANARIFYERMFTVLEPAFRKSIRNSIQTVDKIWADFKKKIQRPIPPLPSFAEPQDLYLILPNSGPYLQQVLREYSYAHNAPRYYASSHLPLDYSSSTATSDHFRTFSNRYFSLAEKEVNLEDDNAVRTLERSFEDPCMRLAKSIEGYLNIAVDAYHSNPEQKSIMLLTVMELWAIMDECATKIFGLLNDYDPGFPSSILDILQLPRLQDMYRLQKIQAYLEARHKKSKRFQMSIFQKPAKGCFADRYYEESPELQRLRKEIEDKAEAARQRKVQEWQNLSVEHEKLIKAIAESSCLYTTDPFQPLIPVHDDHRCRKCFLQRKARRMRIQIHEHPLPADDFQARAVLFELGCPEVFMAYRDATWSILRISRNLQGTGNSEPRVLLRDYSELKAYTKPTAYSLSLASTTKSWLSTHYSTVQFPADLNDICLVNGLKFSYFDTLTKTWPARQAEVPTFVHHCLTVTPKDSPYSSLWSSLDFSADAQKPTSYEVIASQSKCPPGLNVHESAAYQSLLSGTTRRWPSILIELGSSNLNFSSEAIASLISQLALQAGPSDETEALRTVHRFFRDEIFCKRLIEQLDQRLANISSNWRETYLMDTLITLVLRLFSLTPIQNIIDRANLLMEKARAITINWIKLLRTETRKTFDPSISQKYAKYSFWAAILCRKTFAIYLEADENLNPAALRYFIECSITLQDNIIGNPDKLPYLLKNALIRDLKTVHRMRFLLRRSLEAYPDSFASTVEVFRQGSEGDPSSQLSRPAFLPYPDEWWIAATIYATQHAMEQSVHYHLLEGHLLIGGQTARKLPTKHNSSGILEELFGNQSLLTYPSTLIGMDHKLAICPYGHEIHIGSRNEGLIVRACVDNSILEFIPRKMFRSESSFDLPASLIDNCVHWLNLSTGILEIRQKPDIWKLKGSNWLLNCNTHQAQRRRVNLIDPQSRLFHRMERIFHRFEDPQHLTVYQPQKGRLMVELRRLELSFSVNRLNLLESQELRSEIDPNQDAGTWYGLDSKLVLRDVLNKSQRSIIVPTGPLNCKRNGPHVGIGVENEGLYARFTINSILGRLDCPVEPLLLYLKAQFHAFTSFAIPDPLTGRTGTEESLHCLKSGYCQPWAPLNPGPVEILLSIAKLTARRDYYPDNSKLMQRVIWNADLTTTIQHDEFRPVVEAICRRSQRLSLFTLQKNEPLQLEAVGNYHLSHRSSLKRRLYERPDSDSNGRDATPDLPYDARDRVCINRRCKNAFENVSLIRMWPSKMSTATDLARVFQSWPTIGGYNERFDKILFSDIISLQPALEWGSLVNYLRTLGPKHKYRLMFLFAVMSFRDDIEMDMLQTLIAFSIFEDLKVLDLPKWPSYIQFRPNQIPHTDYLVQLTSGSCLPYPGDERGIFQDSLSSKMRRKLAAAEAAHDKQAKDDCKALVQLLLVQWPCPQPRFDGFSRPLLLDIPRALEVIYPEWLRLFQNFEFSAHIRAVQQILDSHYTTEKPQLPNVSVINHDVLPIRYRGGELPELKSDLLRKGYSKILDEPQLTAKHTNLTANGHQNNALNPPHRANSIQTLQRPIQINVPVPSVSREVQELECIIRSFTMSDSSVRQTYGRDMMESLGALKKLENLPRKDQKPIQITRLDTEISKAELSTNEQFDKLCIAFESRDSRVKWLKEGDLWPCITPVTILEQLRSTSTIDFGEYMKESLISYAVSMTHLQHLLRMKDALLKADVQKLSEEQENTGHTNWEPLKYPDWLILEIEANILIRRDQIDVAFATISPISRSSSVMQMNMGQGKTSCIMPMAAAVLANKKKLVRIVVPKSLLLQTAQLIHARLGGLLGRQVIHIPFSRKTPTSPDILKTYHDIHKEMLKTSGVVLALPEHILSFMLSGLQRLSDARIPEASMMIKVQTWMRKMCRDILDECDVTLSLRTQLIYPSGSQKTVDGHPHRWETAETLLHLVEGHLANLRYDFPQSIEVITRLRGGFPVMFFLRKDVEDALLARLVDDICEGRTLIIPIRDCSDSDRLIVQQFISEAQVSRKTFERVCLMFPDKPAAKQAIYLLRGLLVHRILLLTIKKRWNVQYGLHPSRDPIAVPFHAKGIPSDQAEWGHPDVAILFTCLAFYYDGLNLSQLRQSLTHVLRSDDPSSEYDRWAHSSENLPGSLRDWSAVNVDDEIQLTEIWQCVRYNTVVIDYFLNNFVFPKHAKQFNVKLQASGWDIPLFTASSTMEGSQQVSEGACSYYQPLTTGFSGTNDNKTMLPLNIKQQDLPKLSHTNAEVLTYLLQGRSREYVLAANSRGRHLSELELLQMISSEGIRVLIDAGAQILEMDNLSLVKTWLHADYKAPAAVYFDAGNKAQVYYRKGHQIPLLASPFADNLGECLVYLDEAHTRGTDLKIPANARGALTLGLCQTKDHTVQAAMRLRQLANTQSVVFFAPPEVHQSILDLRKKKHGDLIDSSDVIYWLLEQTCCGIEQLQPLYFAHGIDFCRRMQAAYDNPEFLTDSSQRDAYLSILRQNEQQTLKELYRPRTKPKPISLAKDFSPAITSFFEELNARQKKFQDSGNAVHGSALQEVEQEREVEQEVEAVREIQKPVHYSPLSFPGLHRDIISFTRTGRNIPEATGYENAFMALQQTTLGLKHKINHNAIASKLYVSTEFTRTVKLPRGHPHDNFQRPVHWILWSFTMETALIVIPEEAELLIPLIRDNDNSPTHLLTYAAPVTRKMLHFNDLTYYAIPKLPEKWKAPTWLSVELGIFAGRLYFEYEEYTELRKYLDVGDTTFDSADTAGDPLSPVKFCRTGNEESTKSVAQPKQIFTKKPLTFLQEWLAIRRRGQDFAHTPMGYVCQDKPLHATHPFFGNSTNYYTLHLNTKSPKIVRGKEWNANGTLNANMGHFGNDHDGDEDSDDDNDNDDIDYDDEDVLNGNENGQINNVDLYEKDA